MKDELVRKILQRSLEWGTEEIKSEMSDIQIMSKYKYDHYQRFYPGMHFMESLCQWLNQFETIQEKNEAYRFIKKKADILFRD